nr:restriction endonuclease subunit S [uncultured Capnocytophaga sp.]
MEKIRLGDLVNTSSGATPLSSNKEYYENGDIPWINSGEVGQYKINFAEKFITKEGFEKSNTKIFPKDTILVAMYGATAGKTSILNINACTNQAVCAILPSENVNNIFLKYKLDSIYDYLVQISSGSARDNLSQKVIQDLEINLPLLETQQKIAKILSDIDDKIEVLHQINDNLAELAKTIYDYWFVQFDFPDENGKPYKTSGGKMVYNEVLKREIPEGWEVKKLGDVAQFKNGINYEKTSSGSEKVKIINVRNISSSTIFINQTDLDEIFLENDRSTNFLVNDKMILITRSGVPGATRLVSVLEAKTVYSGFIIASEVNDLIFKNLIFYYLKNIEEVLKNQSAGTIMKNISQSVLTEMRISLPPQNVLLKFNTIIHSLFEQMKNVQKQIQHLQSLRDWLLPMLMNGQISVE